MKKIVLGWLYSRMMSTYGDRGNILTIWQRCRWRGIDVQVREIDLKDKIEPDEIDLYFFGGGQDQAQRLIAKDLKEKKDALRKAERLGAVFFGICGGYQLFGHYYKPALEEEIEGLGILDITTIGSGQRMIGNIVVEASKELAGSKPYLLVGFENHSGKTYLGKRASLLGKVVVGSGNNGEDRSEGAFQNNVYGCYLHGPVLPKNPIFADLLIEKALQRKDKTCKLEKLDDALEEKTHQSAISRAKEVG